MVSERFKLFQQDISQRLSSRLDREIIFNGELPWFELGMMYSDLDLAAHNDEVAAELLVGHIITEGLV